MQNSLVGGCWGEPFQSVAHLGGDTMPGQGLLQVPLCRRIPEGVSLFIKEFLLVFVQMCSPQLIG